MSERDTAAAKSFAAEYAAAEESKSEGAAFVEKVDEFTKNPYNNTIADISPDYATRQKKIENLLEKAAGSISTATIRARAQLSARSKPSTRTTYRPRPTSASFPKSSPTAAA